MARRPPDRLPGRCRQSARLRQSGTLASLILGFAAISRRDVPAHESWMLRAYALGMGAGTQALVILPVALLAGPPDAWTYSLLMGLG